MSPNKKNVLQTNIINPKLGDMKVNKTHVLIYNGINWCKTYQYVENSTEDLENQGDMLSLKRLMFRNPTELKNIQNQTEELYSIAIKRDPMVLSYIRNPTKEIISKALEINPECHKYVDCNLFPIEYAEARLKCI